ncbi:MAG: hypothetical protein Q7R60_04130, partial [bacterium]|nr:hypothetical protein [bacterium]
VGIGTTNPVAKLEVAGTAKMTGFQLGTSATAGQVLTTDASGVGTWQTLGAGGGVVSGTGTQNYVSKFNNAGGTTIGNSLIFDNGTNVGIGTASPEQKLHVSGGNILLDNARTLQAKNSTGVVETWMWPRYSDNIMYTNYGASGWNIRNSSSVSTMFMNNSGDVGIGTVAPNAALQIVRDATGGELLRLSGYSPSPDSFYLKVFPVVGSNTVDYRFQTVDNIGGTKDMLYLDSSTGNVGIGTASPNTLLSLGGSLGMKLAVYDGGTAASSYGFGIQSGRMFAQNSAGNEVMVWTSGGNVGIGTTNPVAKLEVAGTAKMTGFQLGTSATAGQVLTTDASGVGT